MHHFVKTRLKRRREPINFHFQIKNHLHVHLLAGIELVEGLVRPNNMKKNETMLHPLPYSGVCNFNCIHLVTIATLVYHICLRTIMSHKNITMNAKIIYCILYLKTLTKINGETFILGAHL